MIVEQIWTGNAYRNFNYLIVCPDTGAALAVDPLDHVKCLARAKSNGWTITQVLNTHEHGDHTGGNGPVIAATGAKLLAHANAGAKIKGIDVGLKAGDVIRVGKTVELEALDTPGHTMSHVCLLSHTDTPALICGDTLFNAGAGNCHGGGHPVELYHTFAEQLAKLPDHTRIYPGHDYIQNNLAFTLDREPDNAAAAALHRCEQCRRLLPWSLEMPPRRGGEECATIRLCCDDRARRCWWTNARRVMHVIRRWRWRDWLGRRSWCFL